MKISVALRIKNPLFFVNVLPKNIWNVLNTAKTVRNSPGKVKINVISTALEMKILSSLFRRTSPN